MTKHRFAFLFKYVLLAAAICAVLCFAAVFARYTTSESETASVTLSGFDVSGQLYVVDGDTETLVGEDMNVGTFQFKSQDASISLKLSVTNSCDFSITCEIEANEYYVLSCTSGGSVTDNVIASDAISGSSSTNIEFTVKLNSDSYPEDGTVISHPLELTVTYNQAE